MIDEQKIISMLQAKALGCLDAEDDKELQSFIDEGHLFPWDEFGVYQNTASLLPLALQLEIPDSELKDKVALKLIKLRDELRAKKLLEEEKQQVEQAEELIEEEVDENVEEFTSAEEPFIDSPIEVEPEPEITEVYDDLNTQLNADEASFNLDEIVLPGFEQAVISEPAPEFDVLENMQTEDPIENLIEEPKIETPTVEEIKVDNVWIEPEISQPIIVEETVTKKVVETKHVEETEDKDKHPDFTKKSVAEKMYRAIEQDFDSLKYHYEESEKKINRGLLIAFLIIAVLFVLLILSFFKFSADMDGLEKEIKELKKKTSSSLIDKQKINSDQHLFS
ncbi:MAG: hypothetical protein Q8M94_19735 [Ignavibacteria bacterium]|nr:hypothetical protein [Ignavibacteria bacterium]